MALMKASISAVFFVVFVLTIFYLAFHDEDAASHVPALIIVFGTIFATSVGRPKPVGITGSRTRKDVHLPALIENLMMGHWIVLICGGVLTAMLQSHILWALAISVFLLMTEYASRSYHKESPEEWEIAFHNEVDGYSSCDGDGDGD